MDAWFYKGGKCGQSLSCFSLGMHSVNLQLGQSGTQGVIV